MLDNQIMQVLVPMLQTQLALWVSSNALQMPAPLVKQNYQPTQQGTPLQPIVILHKISGKRYGSPFKEYKWDDQNNQEVHTETEIIENVYQCSALYIQDPTKVDQITSCDLVGATAVILQNDDVIQYLRDNGLKIYRITDIRMVYFQDDRDRQEVNASFDFTLQHETTTIMVSPTVTAIEVAEYPI